MTTITLDTWLAIRLVGAAAAGDLESQTRVGSPEHRRGAVLALELGTAIRERNGVMARRVLRRLCALADRHVPGWLDIALQHVPVSASEQREARQEIAERDSWLAALADRRARAGTAA